MSDGFIEAKRVYVALVNVCIACLVLSTGNRKKVLKRAPSRANRSEVRSGRTVWGFASLSAPSEVDKQLDAFDLRLVCSPDAET